MRFNTKSLSLIIDEESQWVYGHPVQYRQVDAVINEIYTENTLNLAKYYKCNPVTWYVASYKIYLLINLHQLSIILNFR